MHLNRHVTMTCVCVQEMYSGSSDDEILVWMPVLAQDMAEAAEAVTH